MTVSDNYAPIFYTGNGVTTSFPFTWTISDSDEIVVTKRTILTDEDEVLPSSDYSVVGTFPGTGSVTYNPGGVPLSSAYKLILSREVSFSQDMNITSQGGFYPTVLEDQLDSVVRQTQELKVDFTRSIKVRAGFTPPTLETGDEGDTVVFDDDGNLIPGANQGEIEGAAAAAAAAEAAEAAAELALSQVQAIQALIEDQIESVTPTKLLFTGDGVTTTFALGQAASENTCTPIISGVVQQTNTWQITGAGTDQITFDTAPPTPPDANPNIEIILGGQASVASAAPAANSIGTIHLQNDAVTTAKIDDEAVTLGKLSATLQTLIDTLSDRSVRQFGDVATATAATIDAGTLWTRTTGRVSQGDGGGSLFRNIAAAAPATGYPSFTSADGTNWEYMPTDWAVTFEQFGAVGDGATDDYAACQAAIDFIYARGGGRIDLGWNKLYAVSQVLYLWPRVRLVGCASAWTNQYSNSVGSAAAVPLGSAIFLIAGANDDCVEARFNAYNDGGTLREIGNNRTFSDFRHHGGSIDVCYWGNRSGSGTPPTSTARNTSGSGFKVNGARYLWLERNSALFCAEHGFEFIARDYTADLGTGGTIGSNNLRLYYNNGHSNAKSGFLVAMYDSIVIGNDAGYNGEDGFTGYMGQMFNNNAAWNNLQRGFHFGDSAGYTTTSALSATFVGNNSYDNEWAGFRIGGNGAPMVVGCFARANGRGKVGADVDNANFVITSTARGTGFVGCESAAWDYDAVTPLTYYGFYVSNPTYKTAFAGNTDRGCTVGKNVTTPANILAYDAVS